MTTKLSDTMTKTLPVEGVPLISAPTTGSTVALTPTQPNSNVIFTNGSTVAALTVTVTNGVVDGQVLSIFFKAAVTTCTFSGANWLLTFALTAPTVTAGLRITWIWSAANAGWIRVA